jgi:NADH-ubiquinone oxidoreductase chain 1
MTEHSSVVFVFFFLAEYTSLVLMCIITAVFFLGGYNIDSNIVSYISYYINNIIGTVTNNNINEGEYLSLSIINGLTDGTILAIKSCILIFTFI